MNNIFVYGTLRRGEHNNRLLSRAKFKGFYETEPIYVLRNLGSFPGLMLNGETSVKGELYEVDDDTLEYLDYHEGHPSFYCRMPVSLKDCKDSVEGYVISGHPLYHQELPVIESGDWRNSQL